MSNAPRLRVFAGPNGSGKSTVKQLLKPDLLGFYLNADDIEATLKNVGMLDFMAYGIGDIKDLPAFFAQSTLLQREGLNNVALYLRYQSSCVDFSNAPRALNSYFASVIVDYIRHQLLAQKKSFTFETVMSSPDKVDFMQKAQAAGFRVYLYYVATKDVSINISRVAYRVKHGGHDVPTGKIKSRYTRSLDLLSQAITHSNRAYIFDNSGVGHQWLAEITDGVQLRLKTAHYPQWLNTYILDKFIHKDNS